MSRFIENKFYLFNNIRTQSEKVMVSFTARKIRSLKNAQKYQ